MSSLEPPQEDAKKRREREIIREFVGVCPDLSAVPDPISDEAPDFLIKIDQGILGIEVQDFTRKLPAERQSSQRTKESFRGRLALKACEVFEARHAARLQVVFHGHGQISSVPGREVGPLATAIAETVARFAPERFHEPRLVIPRELGGSGIEDVVHSISITRLSGDIDSLWCFSGATMLYVQPSDIQREIDWKKHKVASYRQKCDWVWLLLVINDPASMASMVDLPGDIDQQHFTTDFDRVYAFERMNKKCVRLV